MSLNYPFANRWHISAGGVEAIKLSSFGGTGWSELVSMLTSVDFSATQHRVLDTVSSDSADISVS